MKFAHRYWLALGLVAGFTCSNSLYALSARSIQVNAELTVNGKVISSPRIVTLEGERSEIAVGENLEAPQMRMAVTTSAVPADETNESVMIDMEFDYKMEGRNIKASPQILAKLGTEAVLNLDPLNKDSVQLKIKAIKVRPGL